MRHAEELSALIGGDARRLAALRAMRALDLPDGWIGAGFVRDAVWDHLHAMVGEPPYGDVDVIWFDRDRKEDFDLVIEKQLKQAAAEFDWSVKNQAHMHRRNRDRPYSSVADAMTFWPETATGVAVRLNAVDELEINAPFGLDDLYALRLLPTPAFIGPKRVIFHERVARKNWLARYPLLRQG